MLLKSSSGATSARRPVRSTKQRPGDLLHSTAIPGHPEIRVVGDLCSYGHTADGKPLPGMVLELAERFNVKLQGLPLIGDSLRDLESVAAVGGQPILVRTGKGMKTLEKGGLPEGTLVFDADTDELIGDLIGDGTRLLVVRGGYHGLGNARFKSSTNRAPRKTTPGQPGEERNLRLELKLLADVGLLGLPNAGKSTLIRTVSAARPKVADYPFTTLHPNLGVVRVDHEQSFVVADIPGLIEGAAEGAGLGHQFLRHLQRTGLLLHIVDLAPFEANVDPVKEAKALVNELKKYDASLVDKPRWLVLNKVDLLEAEEGARRAQKFIADFGWSGKSFIISAIDGKGCRELTYAIMDHLQNSAPAIEDPAETSQGTHPES